MNILHSKIYGEQLPGLPLLVFHGLFGMLDNWGTFAKEFGETMPVHIIDLRNHGKSFHSSEMSIEAMTEDIKNYMNANNIDKANILGHSLGGKAVMSFAVTYPEKVNKLVVVDIAPKIYPPHHQKIIQALRSVDFDQLNSRQEVEKQLKNYIPELSVIQFLLKNLYWDDHKKLGWRFNLNSLADNYLSYMSTELPDKKFEGFTLFLSGQKSSYILAEDEIIIKHHFPNSSIKIVSNAGHWVQAENPKEFNKDVKEFLNT